MRAKLSDLRRHGEIILKERKIDDYRNDVFCLLNKHFGVTRADILLRGEEDLPDDAVMAYMKDIQARGDRTPLQHLLGSWEFMGLSFQVSPDVLIPRPETEWLVNYVLDRYKGQAPRVLDLCTGSGCIGLSVKALLPQAQVTLVDVSELALKVAKANRKSLDVEVKIEQWDILQGVPFFLQKERYDVILSNPPYIKTDDLPQLQPEVQQEPALALDGGMDGLLYYRALARDWTALLAQGDAFVMEAGEDTAQGALEIFEEVLPGAVLHKDLAGLPRYVEAKK